MNLSENTKESLNNISNTFARQIKTIANESFGSNLAIRSSLLQIAEQCQNLSNDITKSLCIQFSESANKMLKESVAECAISFEQIATMQSDSFRTSLQNLAKPLSDSFSTPTREVLDAALNSIDFSKMVSANSPDDQDFEDYVTFDESAAKEWNVPETIAIPVGNNRVRMKTSDFIAILAIIVALVVAFIPSDLERQLQTAVNILQSIDSTLSHQAEALDDLRESIQNNAQEYRPFLSELSDLKQDVSEIKQSVGSIQEALDSETEPDCDKSNE